MLNLMQYLFLKFKYRKIINFTKHHINYTYFYCVGNPLHPWMCDRDSSKIDMNAFYPIYKNIDKTIACQMKDAIKLHKHRLYSSNQIGKNYDC